MSARIAVCLTNTVQKCCSYVLTFYLGARSYRYNFGYKALISYIFYHFADIKDRPYAQKGENIEQSNKAGISKVFPKNRASF